ncbi:NYN domain-containing protein [bacterium]|nr:NYN domain-containing protein [bacterium]
MVYVYIDGESHFIRTEERFKKLHGPKAKLEFSEFAPKAMGHLSYPNENKPLLILDRKCKFFWDKQYVHFLSENKFLRSIKNLERAVYFSSVTGDENLLHKTRVFIREQGFEPRITLELSTLAKRRENELTKNNLIYKAKGVDIGLAVRIIEDAYQNIFHECFLFTSDIDFIPIIQVIQRLGKKVYVCGYRDGLGKNSELEYVPDFFIDLSERVKKYKYNK